MYNCNVQTIPQDRMRYATIGDWFMEGGCLQVKVSSMGNGDYEFLVGMHELIEKQICRKLGITEETVDAWDLAHEDEDEPGAMPDCPYREAHMIAQGFERALAVKLGVDWDHYSQTIKAIMEKTRPPLDPTIRDNPDPHAYELRHKDQHGKMPSRYTGNPHKMAKGKVKERSVLRGK